VRCVIEQNSADLLSFVSIDNAFHSITYQPPTVSCQQLTTEHLDRLCYSPKPFTSPRFPAQSLPQFSSLPSNRFNPFRAFLIVNRATSSIVSVNRQACEYFWYTENELKNKSIESLIVNQKSTSVIADSFLSQQSGQTKILAGKIVHVLLGTGERARFSLFIQDLDGEQSPLRFYAFEPIHTMQMKLICDREGSILSSDSHFSILFHNTMIESHHENDNQHIGDFIPTLKDKSKFKQLSTHRIYRTTGLLNSEKNLSIPMMMTISKTRDEQVEVNLSVMSNISGLIMLDETYTIRAYNPYFVQCLLGYRSLDLINHVSVHERLVSNIYPIGSIHLALVLLEGDSGRVFLSLPFTRPTIMICLILLLLARYRNPA
jgi:PAS domain-containing protein